MIETLQRIIEKNTGKTGIVLTEDTLLLTGTGMNSYELVQMVCEVEDEFDIEIPDKAIKTFKTVGDVLRYIDTY